MREDVVFWEGFFELRQESGSRFTLEDAVEGFRTLSCGCRTEVKDVTVFAAVLPDVKEVTSRLNVRVMALDVPEARINGLERNMEASGDVEVGATVRMCLGTNTQRKRS